MSEQVIKTEGERENGQISQEDEGGAGVGGGGGLVCQLVIKTHTHTHTQHIFTSSLIRLH